MHQQDGFAATDSVAGTKFANEQPDAGIGLYKKVPALNIKSRRRCAGRAQNNYRQQEVPNHVGNRNRKLVFLLSEDGFRDRKPEEQLDLEWSLQSDSFGARTILISISVRYNAHTVREPKGSVFAGGRHDSGTGAESRVGAGGSAVLRGHLSCDWRLTRPGPLGHRRHHDDGSLFHAG